MTSARSNVVGTCAGAVIALVALTAGARAQAYQCKPTETQAECHARLQCKPDEEVEDCQERLQAAAKSRGGQRGDDRGGDDDRGRDDDRGGDDDRGRYDDDRGRDEGRGRGDRGRRGGGRRRGGGGGGGSFQSDRTFGLGLELGTPTGLNGKYFVAPTGALNFGVGYVVRHYYYDEGIHLYLDYLFHPTSLASTPSFDLPFYVGVGGRYWEFDYCFQGVCGYDAAAIGLRVPLGLSFDFKNAPLDIFLQLTPVIDFLRDDYYDRFRDRTHLGLDFSVGLRFWLK